MAGGRKLDSVSEIRARLAAPETATIFDQHPRHTGRLLAPDEQAPLVVVGGRHDLRGWQVLLLRGGVTEAALAPAAARALAEQLRQMADICDGGRW